MDYDYLGAMIRYESGELDEEQTVELFQFLIDNSIIQNLQGSYQRAAIDLIRRGYCHMNH
jgi:hypothetical protein